uniref:CHCH domain-containing protein n=1 Tax=Oryza nivara TaxID=4536 RepID=A0A0E0IIA6_ORYNI
MVFGRSKSSSSTASPPPAAAASSAAAAACSELRAAYHECFNRWYAEKFAKGQCHKDDCVGEWHKYRACLEEHLEDKNLRQILLESETSAYYAQFDADSSSRKGGTSTK